LKFFSKTPLTNSRNYGIINTEREVRTMTEREIMIAMLNRIGATYYTGTSENGVQWIEVVAGFERAMCFNFDNNGQAIDVE
jgi:hypothetical protein